MSVRTTYYENKKALQNKKHMKTKLVEESPRIKCLFRSPLSFLLSQFNQFVLGLESLMLL